MLLSQIASQLNTYHQDAFHKALFPSGNVSKLDILKETLSDLGVRAAPSTPVSAPSDNRANDTNKIPTLNESSTQETISRKQRRSTDRLSKKVEKANEKANEKREKTAETLQTRLQTIRDEIKSETKSETKSEIVVKNERLDRILGLH